MDCWLGARSQEPEAKSQEPGARSQEPGKELGAEPSNPGLAWVPPLLTPLGLGAFLGAGQAGPTLLAV